MFCVGTFGSRSVEVTVWDHGAMVIFALCPVLLATGIFFAHQILYWLTGALLLVGGITIVKVPARELYWQSRWGVAVAFLAASMGYLIPMYTRLENRIDVYLRPCSFVE